MWSDLLLLYVHVPDHSVCVHVVKIAAMQAGLLKVVPQAVLDLLTWQEVEKKVCGDPEITVEALKRLSECPARSFI